MHDVFVYGTLKRGFPNFEYNMLGARYVGRYRTVDAFPLVVGGLWHSPYLIDEPGQGHQVIGELFAVSDAHLPRLDELESVHLPNGYRRCEIQIAAETDGTERTAWVYLKDRDTIEGIHDGPMAEYPSDPRYIPPSDPRRKG